MSEEKDQTMNEVSALASPREKQGIFTELWQQARLVFYLLADREVPIYLKALPFAAFLYLLFPIDFLPDVIPGIGQLDDLTLIVIGAKMFIEMAPETVVNHYLNQMRNRNGDASPLSNLSAEQPFSDDPDIIDGIIIDGGNDPEPIEK